MRLFVGFFLPEHVNAHLAMALEAVGGGHNPGAGRPALRWVQPEQRHITLGFYGEVPAGAVDELTSQLESELASVEPLDLRLRGAGVFSGRTLWAGVQEQSAAVHSNGSSPLIDLMRQVDEIGAGYARNADLPGARERRRAHLTLARARDRRKAAAQIRSHAEALAVYEGPRWKVGTAYLVASELGAGKSGAPFYSTVAELPLG